MERFVSWLPVEGATGYRIRVSEPDTNAGPDVYAERSALVNPDVDDDGKMRVDLSLLDVMPDEDGVYDITITAVDADGKESPFALIDDKELDVVPLDAPKEFTAEF